jgi:Immunity protein 50
LADRKEFPVELEGIGGARDLWNWFGYWPSFHDAEVISLHLDRLAGCLLTVHTWEMTNAVDDQGYYILTKDVAVTFVINDVLDLNLNGFSNQSILFGLEIEKTDGGYRVNLDSLYGFGGAIEAKQISIRLRPGKPTAT